MREESNNWLDYALKGQQYIETTIGYILKEYGMSEDIKKEELETRCQTKFEVYSNPVYAEYQIAISTLIQVLRITGWLE